MAHTTVDCEVEEDDKVFGEYANAFRLLHEGDELLLDFCLYQDGRAKLVRRLRVTRGMFEAMVERMNEGKADLRLEDGLLATGGVVVFGGSVEAEG